MVILQKETDKIKIDIEDPFKEIFMTEEDDKILLESPQKKNHERESDKSLQSSTSKTHLVRLDKSQAYIAARFSWKFTTEEDPSCKEYMKISRFLKGRTNLINHQNVNYYSVKEGPLYAGAAYGIDYEDYLGEKGCRVMALFVDPMHRGKGLSKVLMRFFINRAKSLGFRRIKLDCYFKNDRAQGLYHKLGFKFCSEIYSAHYPINVTSYIEDNISEDVFKMLMKSYEDIDGDGSDGGSDSQRSNSSENEALISHNQPAQRQRRTRVKRRLSHLLAPGSKGHKLAYTKLQDGQSFINLLRPEEDLIRTEDILIQLMTNKPKSPFPQILDEEEGTFKGPSPATIYIVDHQEDSKVLGLVGISNMTCTSKNKFHPHVTHILVDPSVQNIKTIALETVEALIKICLQDWNCFEVNFEIQEQKKADGCFRIQDLLLDTFDCEKEDCGIYEIDFGSQNQVGFDFKHF